MINLVHTYVHIYTYEYAALETCILLAGDGRTLHVYELEVSPCNDVCGVVQAPQ